MHLKKITRRKMHLNNTRGKMHLKKITRGKMHLNNTCGKMHLKKARVEKCKQRIFCTEARVDFLRKDDRPKPVRAERGRRHDLPQTQPFEVVVANHSKRAVSPRFRVATPTRFCAGSAGRVRQSDWWSSTEEKPDPTHIFPSYCVLPTGAGTNPMEYPNNIAATCVFASKSAALFVKVYLVRGVAKRNPREGFAGKGLNGDSGENF